METSVQLVLVQPPTIHGEGGGGGATKGEGGHVKFYPYEKGGRKKFRTRDLPIL